MASTFETGHAKNVANLEKYNQFLATLGTAYNPANANLSLSALTAFQLNAKANLTTLKVAEDNWKDATNLREIAFENLNTFSTQLLGLLKSTEASQQTINDFTFLADKMRGSSKKTTKADAGKATKADAGKTIDPSTLPPIVEEPTPPTTISTSQQSFDQKLEHFEKMVLILAGVATYTPNEPQTQVATLQTQLTTLSTLNTTANDTHSIFRAARISRNTLFYSENGMLDLVRKSKNYILGVFKKSSQQYKTAITYKFVRVVQKKKAQ